jgi:hypothetical protein
MSFAKRPPNSQQERGPCRFAAGHASQTVRKHALGSSVDFAESPLLSAEPTSDRYRVSDANGLVLAQVYSGPAERCRDIIEPADR